MFSERHATGDGERASDAKYFGYGDLRHDEQRRYDLLWQQCDAGHERGNVPVGWSANYGYYFGESVVEHHLHGDGNGRQ